MQSSVCLSCGFEKICVVDANGAWAVDWKAVAGVAAARLRVPATAGLVAA
jgi:hypothetical protein